MAFTKRAGKKNPEEERTKMVGTVSPMTRTRPIGAKATRTISMKVTLKLPRPNQAMENRRRVLIPLNLADTSPSVRRGKVIHHSVPRTTMILLVVIELFSCQSELHRTLVTLQLAPLHQRPALTIHSSCQIPKIT